MNATTSNVPMKKLKRKTDDLEEELASITEMTVAIRTYLSCTAPVPPIKRIRWNSQYLRNLAAQEGSFVVEYRVTPSQFDVLCDILEPHLCVNASMAALCAKKTGSDPIGIDSVVGQAMIILSGGRCMESMRTHGVSKNTVYYNLQRFVNAVNSCEVLSLPTSYDLGTLQLRANEFKSRSSFGLFEFCVGAIDGLAIQIVAPSRKMGGGLNAKKFFSGSKKYYCVNMQGVCDAHCRFSGMSCKTVGSTNDCDAFNKSGLRLMNQSLPPPFHDVGDGAYVDTETLMCPYGLDGCPSVWKESFDFYHSQIRITIERAFGMLIQRFGVFWRPLKFHVRFVFQLVLACVRLHNFILSFNDNAPSSIWREQLNLSERLLTDVDLEGRLTDPIWRAGVPREDSLLDGYHANTRGNYLKTVITKRIEELQIIKVRSHNL